MNKDDDPYEILGVGYDATEDEIKKAYRKGALKYHPDKQTTDEDREKAHDIFAKLSAAYDTLTDPVKRYDWKQKNEDKMKASTHSASSKPRPTAAPASAPAPAPAPPRPVPTTTPRPPPRKNSAPPSSMNRPVPPPPPNTRTPPPGRTRRSSVQEPGRGAGPRPSTTPGRGNAPPPPNAFSWSRAGKKPTPNTPKPTGNKTATNGSAPNSNGTSYTYTPTTNKKEDPRAPNTEYGGVNGMKEDLRSPPGRQTKKDTSYNAAGVGAKEDLKSPVSAGRTKKRASVVKPSETSYSAAGVGAKEDLRSPPAKKTVKKKNKSAPSSTSSSSAYPKTSNSPAETLKSPRSASPKRKSRIPAQIGGIAAPPLADDASDAKSVSSRHTYAAGQERAAPQRRGSGSSAPGRKSRSAKPSSIRRARSQSPRQGRKSDILGQSTRTARSGAKKNSTRSVKEVHDPFETFEKFVKLEFADEEFASYSGGEWVGKRMFGGDKKSTKLKAKALDFYDPNAVMSMSTSTKTEKREDGMYDVKTITKILRGDGSVETVRQASVCDKERAKSIPKDKTVTITRKTKK